jgi:hypothetical protein
MVYFGGFFSANKAGLGFYFASFYEVVDVGSDCGPAPIFSRIIFPVATVIFGSLSKVGILTFLTISMI